MFKTVTATWVFTEAETKALAADTNAGVPHGKPVSALSYRSACGVLEKKAAEQQGQQQEKSSSEARRLQRWGSVPGSATQRSEARRAQ